MAEDFHADLDRHEQLLEEFDEALAGGGTDWVDSLTEPIDDPALARRLARGKACLLLLERVWPRGGSFPQETPEVPGECIPRQVGRFRIVRELGRGGFGVVYLAEDPKLGRRVALKVPRPDRLFAPHLRQRFLRESRAAAALDHPHITPVFETGEIGSACYLVSAYCAGGTLAEYLAQRDELLSPRSAARLVARLADAVQYAHTRGVLHRDLKPANVLVEFACDAGGGGPGDLPFVPRLTDFGLARFLDSDADKDDSSRRKRSAGEPSLATGTGTILGTPGYMAPEQVEGDSAAIGPATDVYGLGAILYELLTGEAPFSRAGKPDLLRQVLTEEPAPPRRLRPETPRDLEAICLKCLEKDPGRRYPSVELIADLHRYLRGAPTLVRPLTVTQRAVRWLRRQPAAAALIGVVALAVFGAIAGLSIHSARLRAYAGALESSLKREAEQSEEANRNRRIAEERELAARRQDYVRESSRAWRLWCDDQGLAMCELLNHQRPLPGQEDLRGFEWRYLWRLGGNLTQMREHLGSVNGVRFSRDGRLCASWNRGMDRNSGETRANDRAIKVWDVPTRTLRWSLQGGGPPLGAKFAPDGRRLISVHGSGTIHTWDVNTGRRLDTQAVPAVSLPDSRGLTLPLAFSPNGREFAYTVPAPAGEESELEGDLNAAGQSGRKAADVIRLWDIPTGTSRMLPEPQEPMIVAAEFSPDGRMLAVGSRASPAEEIFAVQVFDAATGKELHHLTHRKLRVSDFSFSPDGKRLALGCWRETAIWNMETGSVSHFPGDSPAPFTVAFSPTSDMFASGSTHRSENGLESQIRILQGATGAVLAEPSALDFPLSCVDLSAKGVLAYGGEHGLLRFWSVRQQDEFQRLVGHTTETWCVAFSPESSLLASGSDDHTVKIWDARTGREKVTAGGHTALVAAVAFSPDGRTLATASFDKSIKLWDPTTGTELATLAGHDGPVRCLAFAPDGNLLASVADDRSVRLWNVPARQRYRTLQGHENKTRAAVFHPRGRFLFTSDNAGLIKLWDTQDGSLVRSWEDASEVHSLAITPQGDILAAGSKEGLIRLYSIPVGQRLVVLEGQPESARSLAFSTDGGTLASGGEDATVTLWHVATGEELFALRGVNAQVNGLAFSPDGRTLAAAAHDGAVTLWRAEASVP
jgi:eukaryotic-like serine/threonine-protein kinase